MNGFKINSNLMVSVCMITYNHEKYIHDAIAGILIQKVNFEIELVIGDDHSTDATLAICKEYEKNKAIHIKTLTADKNLGIGPNFIRTLQACEGKYIAVCEGDDYWTDPNKLQKQITFLEANPKYSAIGHQTEIINENCPGKSELFTCYEEKTLSKKEIIQSNVFHTNAIVFRKDAFAKFKYSNIQYFFDHELFILLAQSGMFYILSDVMSVYRRHDSGAAGTSTPKRAYYEQIGWITELRTILGLRFFWGYNFLSSEVQCYYALNHPDVFDPGFIMRLYYFIKYASITILLYPRNIKAAIRLIPKLIQT